MKKGKLNYRCEGDTYLIELKLPSLSHLFNSLDPLPFREKDLDTAAEEYLFESAAELPLDASFKLVIHLPVEECDESHQEEVAYAIHNYFTYRATVAERQFSRILLQGRRAMLIGLLFLFTCIIAQHIITLVAGETLFWSIIEEGLLITGWVAMWYPINLFLYEWWPIRHRQRLLEKLAELPVELQAITESHKYSGNSA